MPLLNKVKRYREDMSISQSELGKMVGVLRQTISSIERGDYHPSIVVALKLSNVFNEKSLTLTLAISTMMLVSNILCVLVNYKNLSLLFLFTINLTLGSYLEVAHINLLKKVEPTRYADPLSPNFKVAL